MNSIFQLRIAACLMTCWWFTSAAHAVTGVNPSGVNVNSNGVTTVFLTFQNLNGNERPLESFWCGAVTTTGVTPFDPCVPGSVFGRLPARNDLSSVSGTGGNQNLTDIMTIPVSVARRALEDARRGNPSDFFYVRRFSNGISDTYVTVTCRMAGGGARVPLALTEVHVAFDVPDGDRPVHFLARDSKLPPFGATLKFNGSGRLKGRWELMRPGDIEPTIEDLLTEATLPVELRAQQQRYSLIDRFDVVLTPTGEFFLPGPNPERIHADTDGAYRILLRIEATEDKEATSNAGNGIVLAGGVAGFPMPSLRLFVGSPDTFRAAEDRDTEELGLLLPAQRAKAVAETARQFSWLQATAAALYRLEIISDTEEVLTAFVPGGTSDYTTPPWALREGRLRWRVSAEDATGRLLQRSQWRVLIVDSAGEGG